MVTRLFINFSDAKRAANSVVGDGILIKLKLIQVFMVVRDTCMSEDPSKNEGTRVVTLILPI